MTKRLTAAEFVARHNTQQDLISEELNATFANLPNQQITERLCDQEGLPYDAEVAEQAALSPRDFDMYWRTSFIDNIAIAQWGRTFPTRVEQLEIMTKVLVKKYRVAIRERLN